MEIALALFVIALCWHAFILVKLRSAGSSRAASVLSALASAEAELLEKLRHMVRERGLSGETRFEELERAGGVHGGTREKDS